MYKKNAVEESNEDSSKASKVIDCRYVAEILTFHLLEQTVYWSFCDDYHGDFNKNSSKA